MASWWRKYVMDQSPISLGSGSWQRKAAILAGTTTGNGSWASRQLVAQTEDSGSWDRRLADGDHSNAPNKPWAAQL